MANNGTGVDEPYYTDLDRTSRMDSEHAVFASGNVEMRQTSGDKSDQRKAVRWRFLVLKIIVLLLSMVAASSVTRYVMHKVFAVHSPGTESEQNIVSTEGVKAALPPSMMTELVPGEHLFAYDASTKCALKIYFGVEKTFGNASTFCEATGYHLAFFKNAHAYQFFSKVACSYSDVSSVSWYYIGGQADKTLGQYHWLDGTAVTYTEWAPRQPEDNDGHDILGLWNVNGTYRTDNNKPTWSTKFICQKCL